MLRMLVVVFCLTLLIGIPLDLASLYFALVQAVFTCLAFVDNKEEHGMKNSFLVASGTHGVVQGCWGKADNYYKCRVGSSPTRSTIKKSPILG